MSPTYSPRTELFYVMAYDGEAEFYIRDEDYLEGARFTGGGQQRVLPLDKFTSAVRAYRFHKAARGQRDGRC